MAAIVGPNAYGNGDTTQVDSEALQPVGSVGHDVNGNVYIYAKGVASVAAGSWVNLDVGTDYTVALLDTDVAATQLGRIAIAMAAIVADKYGWFAIEGTLIPGASLASATDAKNAYATSTAGSVDDSGAGAEVVIFGAFYVSAVDTPSTGLAYFALSRPFMQGLTLD